ncbi:hypothetical protein QF000_006973 [Paraburkholderia atlantica]|uniref:hypothetical protein n=1 Tax=Paraburkholderia atlantica TaxID=2654982 RepID=UPI003D223F16
MRAFDERVDLCEAMLREWLDAHGETVTPDDCVCERIAAALCGSHDRTYLAQRVRDGLSVPRYRTTGTRRFFRIRDIAIWLELGYDDCGL